MVFDDKERERISMILTALDVVFRSNNGHNEMGFKGPWQDVIKYVEGLEEGWIEDEKFQQVLIEAAESQGWSVANFSCDESKRDMDLDGHTFLDGWPKERIHVFWAVIAAFKMYKKLELEDDKGGKDG